MKTIKVLVSDQERAHYGAEAARELLSLSAWCRRALAQSGSGPVPVRAQADPARSGPTVAPVRAQPRKGKGRAKPSPPPAQGAEATSLAELLKGRPTTTDGHRHGP